MTTSEFGIRKLMSWNKLNNGELAVMDNEGQWKPYTQHPLYQLLNKMGQGKEYFPEMSKGYRTMQLLLKQGYIIVNKEDY